MAPGKYLQQAACPLAHGSGVKVPLDKICMSNFPPVSHGFGLEGCDYVCLQGFLGKRARAQT
jgi:hypothetical protein